MTPFSQAIITQTAMSNFICNMDTLGVPSAAIDQTLDRLTRAYLNDRDFIDALARAYADAVQARSEQAVDAMREGAREL